MGHSKQPDFLSVAHFWLLGLLIMNDPLNNAFKHLLGFGPLYTLTISYICFLPLAVIICVIALSFPFGENWCCFMLSLLCLSSPFSLAFVAIITSLLCVLSGHFKAIGVRSSLVLYLVSTCLEYILSPKNPWRSFHPHNT